MSVSTGIVAGPASAGCGSLAPTTMAGSGSAQAELSVEDPVPNAVVPPHQSLAREDLVNIGQPMTFALVYESMETIGLLNSRIPLANESWIRERATEPVALKNASESSPVASALKPETSLPVVDTSP